MATQKNLLAGDIGGTKTLLRLMRGDIVLCEQRYESAAWEGLEPMVADLLGGRRVDAACFGVAGPVHGRAARITNLPWHIDADAIAQHLSVPQVALINDFQAVAYGVEALGPDDLLTLQAGQPQEKAPRAVIGAGTGLGEGYLVWQGEHYVALPSEGSHADFAPASDLQVDLWRWLGERFGHVSWERVVSGPGLEAIYRFLRERGEFPESTLLGEMMRAGDAAAAISDFALHHHDPLASAALDLFIAAYGAEAGNLALKILASGGVYLAGGITPKIVERLKDGGFMGAFLAKGRFAELLATIPVTLVLNPKVGLLGAQQVASRL